MIDSYDIILMKTIHVMSGGMDSAVLLYDLISDKENEINDFTNSDIGSYFKTSADFNCNINI